jgi:hypothetical protein
MRVACRPGLRCLFLDGRSTCIPSHRDHQTARSHAGARCHRSFNSALPSPSQRHALILIDGQVRIAALEMLPDAGPHPIAPSPNPGAEASSPRNTSSADEIGIALGLHTVLKQSFLFASRLRKGGLWDRTVSCAGSTRPPTSVSFAERGS